MKNTKQNYIENFRNINNLLSNYVKGMKMLNNLVESTKSYPGSISFFSDTEENITITANWEFAYVTIYGDGLVELEISRDIDELRTAYGFGISRSINWSTSDQIPEKVVKYFEHKAQE